MPHAIRVHQYGGPEVLTWEEVEVGTAARLTGCLVGRGVLIGAHTRVTPGAVLGDGTRLSDYSRLAGD